MCQQFVSEKNNSVPIYIAEKIEEVDLSPFEQHWFQAVSHQNPKGVICLPDETGGLSRAILLTDKKSDMWHGALLSETLPDHKTYYLVDDADLQNFAYAWGVAHYTFDRFKTKKESKNFPKLYVPEPLKADVEKKIAAVTLVRDLINRPASDLTPAVLGKLAVEMAESYHAKVEIIEGEKLEKEYPMVHAVGRASINRPQVFDMVWGDPKHTSVCLIGKGVTFDSGGLDIKPSSNMLLMKKDMGGAAHALSLAGLIMSYNLPIYLRLILPMAENSISDNAYRPGDILTSRKGLTVEVSDTDAEGRLLLADALTAAGEKTPDYIFDFATLTGAARVAVGTEVAAFFTNDFQLASSLKEKAASVREQIWELPLLEDYKKLIHSAVADTASCSAGGYGGAITAALFLEKFVPTTSKWLHFDIMAWNVSSRPGRPVGGEAMGLFSAFEFLRAL